MPQTTTPLEVLATEPVQLYELLDNAEAKLRQEQPPECLAGILVTRHTPGRYTLRLSDAVPFGETREQILT